MTDDRTKESPLSALPKLVEQPTPQPTTQPMTLEAIFESHHATVFRAAYRVTGSLEDAEDVQQTVFLKLATSGIPRGVQENAGGYLRRAAINAAIDLVRARRTARLLPLVDDPSVQLADDSPSPMEARIHRELEDRVRKALLDLSARSAEIFVLRYFEGYRNKEIAHLLDTSESAVAVILHRARLRLREALSIGAGESR